MVPLRAAHFNPSDGAGSANVLAKIVIGLPGEFDYASFRQFDRKIMMVRDPRDKSSAVFSMHPVRRRRSARTRRRSPPLPARCSARKPIPVVYPSWLCPTCFVVSTDWTGAFWLTMLHDLALDFHRANDDSLVYSYEDFIAGRYAAIEDYPPFALPGGEADVTAQYEHVVRTKMANDWKNWFTADDVAYFRPRVAAFMRAYGYADDWTLATEPQISAAHGSEFVRRSIALR